MALNLSTENLARSSASHHWRVILVWVAVLVAAMVVIMAFLEDGLTTAFVFTNDPEVQHGEELLEAIRGPKGTNEVVVFESTKYTIDDPEYKRAVEDLTAELAKLGPEIIRLETLENFYSTGAPPLGSDDRSATLIGLVMAGDFDTNSENIDVVVDVVHEAAEAERADFDIKITGQATIGLDNR
jgi:uncharacterized membrane protein YdfJ with MMPL/SSD domain